jgi:hypothetical protein
MNNTQRESSHKGKGRREKMLERMGCDSRYSYCFCEASIAILSPGLALHMQKSGPSLSARAGQLSCSSCQGHLTLIKGSDGHTHPAAS